MNALLESYETFFAHLGAGALQHRVAAWRSVVHERAQLARHGALPRWCAVLNSLPDIAIAESKLSDDAVAIVATAALGSAAHAQLEALVLELSPWRKGPFDLLGVHIDAEWRSDRKWRRLVPYLAPLAGRTVLDVGAGNGYYALRSIGAGAHAVLGVDPMLLYCVQAAAVGRYVHWAPASGSESARHAHVLPLRLADMGEPEPLFDTVLSMGVLYHQRDQEAHLAELTGWLRPGGQLVLETLVLAGAGYHVLHPTDRYARMRNVFNVPSVDALLSMLMPHDLHDLACVDICATTTDEQRATRFMTFESLSHALDPERAGYTVEGHPAPLRAIVTATKGVKVRPSRFR